MPGNTTNMEPLDVEDASRVNQPITLRQRITRAFYVNNTADGIYVNRKFYFITLVLLIVESILLGGLGISGLIRLYEVE